MCQRITHVLKCINSATYILTYMNSDNIFLLKSPLYFHVVLSLRSPGCPSLSPTNVRHFLTSPVVNLPTSYPRATKKEHQNVRTFPSAIDEIQTILASIASLCALEMFVSAILFVCVLQADILIVSFSIKPFWKHFFTTRKPLIHENQHWAFWGGNPFLSQGVASSELLTKHNIEDFLRVPANIESYFWRTTLTASCVMSPIWVFLLRVFPLLTLFIIPKVAKNTFA